VPFKARPASYLQKTGGFYIAAGAHRFSQRSFLAEDGRSRFVVSKVSNSRLEALELQAEYKAVLFIGIQEGLNSGKCIAKQETGTNSSAIAYAQPDHFRRASTQNAQF
jgi:hypothetical protein